MFSPAYLWMRDSSDLTRQSRAPMSLPRVRFGAGARLPGEWISRWRLVTADCDFNAAHGDRMVIALYRPCNFDYISMMFGFDHQADGIGIGLRGSFAVAAPIAEVTVATQGLRLNGRRWIRRAVAAKEIAERYRNGNQLAQR
jgi:hypothetical protein